VTVPPAAAEFVAQYPALAIPFSLIVYLVLARTGVRMSRELLYVIVASPGLINLWAWTYYWDVPGWAGWAGFLQGSALLMPTNILAPLLMVWSVISVLLRKLRRLQPSKLSKRDAIVLALMAVAYLYDQMIVTGAQTP
jgi:hypothetical protein